VRSISDVCYPSQKVWLFDLFDRHFYKRTIWHAYPMARQPLLFFDGSCRIEETRNSNDGWINNNQSSPAPTWYQYYPTQYEPRTLSGAPADLVKGMFRWTRGGMRGVDFGGREIRTR
jgi:hypothetical protein